MMTDFSFMDVEHFTPKCQVPDTFMIHPPTDAEKKVTSANGAAFYALPAENQKSNNGAVGIAVHKDRVVIMQAVVDLEKMLGRDQYACVYQHSLECQEDFFGCAKMTTQRGRGRSGGRGRDGGRGRGGQRDSCWLGFGSVRSTPKALRDLNPGFSTQHWTHAVVLHCTYPRYNGRIDWCGQRPPEFKCQPILLDGEWKQQDLIELSAESEASDIDDQSDEANLKVFVQFCSHIAGRSHHKENEHRLMIHNTPSFNFKEKKILPESREFLGTKRHIVDTLSNEFNNAALQYLTKFAADGDVDILGRKSDPIPGDVMALLKADLPEGLVGKSLSCVTPHIGVPLRAFANSLAKTYSFGPPAEFTKNTYDRFVEAKFNVPLREFSSLYNLRVLTAVLGRHSTQSFAVAEGTRAKILSHLKKHADAHLQKMKLCYTSQPLETVGAELSDGSVMYFSMGLGIALHHSRAHSTASAPILKQLRVPFGRFDVM